MSNESSESSGGIGIFGLLLVAFIILKIVGVEPIAHWSWWWVMAPLWAPIAIGLALWLISAALTNRF